MTKILEDLKKAIVEGEDDDVIDLTKQALADGITANTIVEDGLTAGMDEVGELFEAGDYFVPEMLLSANAFEGAMVILRPLLQVTNSYESLGRVILGSVEGDLHDIGKKLVGMMIEGAGFEVTDLGIDVPTTKFIEAVNESGAKIVGLSALLTTTMPAMDKTVREIREMCPGVKIMVGGAPVTPAFAEQVGADGFAHNASKAADVARELVS